MGRLDRCAPRALEVVHGLSVGRLPAHVGRGKHGDPPLLATTGLGGVPQCWSAPTRAGTETRPYACRGWRSLVWVLHQQGGHGDHLFQLIQLGGTERTNL